MKRISIGLNVALFYMAQLVTGCGAQGDIAPAGQPAQERATSATAVPLSAEKLQQGSKAFSPDLKAPVYRIGISARGQTVDVQVRPTEKARELLLRSGFQGKQGEEAIQAFLRDLLQRDSDGGKLNPAALQGAVLAIDPNPDRAGVRESANTALCVTCWDVYVCGWWAGCGCTVCVYDHTTCAYYSC